MESMSKENLKALLFVTEKAIEFYSDFMIGRGNCDEFENELYSHYFDGAYEDYLVFGNDILIILNHRKWKIEKILKEGDGNE